MRFFRQVSPVDELAELTIGSRPASRRTGGRLEDLRAIPWVFAWTQNRILLPSWFGAGTALEEGELELQREMWRSWPFFRMACSTLEMALFKVDLEVGRRYLALVDDELAERYWPLLEAEHARVVARLLAIREGELAARRRAGAARPPLAPQPLGRPALAPPGRAAGPLAGRRRDGRRRADGNDHGHRRGAAQHGLIRPVRLAVLVVVDGRTTRRWAARYGARARSGRVQPMSPTVTPRPPVSAAQHAFTIPVVRELPPVYRPGTFDSTW